MAKKKKEEKIPRPISYVKFDYKNLPKEHHKHYIDEFDPKQKRPRWLFMGECPQAPGHCYVFDLEKQKMIGMYHTSNFVELTEDEV